MSFPEIRKAQRIKKIIPMTNGIFGHMNYTFKGDLTKNSLDMMFFTNYGMRNPSPAIEALQDEYDEPLDNQALTALATLVLEMYKPKWDRLGAVYDIEYDPIHNFLDEWEDTSEEVLDDEQRDTGTKMTTYGQTTSSTNQRTDNLSTTREVETTNSSIRTDDLEKLETRDLANTNLRTDNLTESNTYGKTVTRTDNLLATNTYGKSVTRTDNLTEEVDSTKTTTGSGSEAESLYGYNSTVGVNSNSSTNNNSNSETFASTKDNTGTQTSDESGSDSTANTGTQENVESGSDSTQNTGTQSDSGSDTGTITTENTGTQQNSGTGTVDESISNTGTRTNVLSESHGGNDTITNNLTHTDDYTRNRDRSGRHFGNIGNLTSQKQILEEINLWRWNYMQEILNDVKEFCTLPVYLNATEWSWVNPQD